MVAANETVSAKFDEWHEKSEIKRRKIRLEALALKNEDSLRLEKEPGSTEAHPAECPASDWTRVGIGHRDAVRRRGNRYG
jgi:hypothetical protein